MVAQVGNLAGTPPLAYTHNFTSFVSGILRSPGPSVAAVGGGDWPRSR